MPADWFDHSPEFWRSQFGSASDVDAWHYYAFDWLDDLSFMPVATELFAGWREAKDLLAAVEANWRLVGWDGDGETLVLWLPPFTISNYEPAEVTHRCGDKTKGWVGRYALHVKQLEDGTSWLASPHELPGLGPSPLPPTDPDDLPIAF